MPKINSSNMNGLLIKYALKIILSSVLSVLLLNTLCSFAVLKFDLNLEVLRYAGAAICIISAFIISFISISGFKNNYLVLSMISVLPLMIYTIINFCFNKSDAVFIIIKIAGIIIAAFIVSLVKSGKKSR